MKKTTDDVSKIEYHSALQILRLLYQSAVDILETAITDNPVPEFQSPALNACLIPLLPPIKQILARKDFTAFSDGVNYLHSTLLGDDDRDIDWKYDKIQAYEFLAEIDIELLKYKNFAPLPSAIQKLLDNASAGRETFLKSARQVDMTLSSLLENEGKKRLIEKNNRGDFYYDGNLIDMKRGTIHYNLFDILFSHSNQEGFISYDDIDALLIKAEFPELDGADAVKKRISNALSNQLFHLAKVNGKRFENKTLDGKELISTVRGKGLKLNNPAL